MVSAPRYISNGKCSIRQLSHFPAFLLINSHTLSLIEIINSKIQWIKCSSTNHLFFYFTRCKVYCFFLIENLWNLKWITNNCHFSADNPWLKQNKRKPTLSVKNPFSHTHLKNRKNLLRVYKKILLLLQNSETFETYNE